MENTRITEHEFKNETVFMYKLVLGGGEGDVIIGLVSAKDYLSVEDFKDMISVYLVAEGNTLDVTIIPA